VCVGSNISNEIKASLFRLVMFTYSYESLNIIQITPKRVPGDESTVRRNFGKKEINPTLLVNIIKGD
jgi:hypothetical protein